MECRGCGQPYILEESLYPDGVERCQMCEENKRAGRAAEMDRQINAASEKQVAFLQRLADERNVTIDTANLTKSEASAKIERLMATAPPTSPDYERALEILRHHAASTGPFAGGAHFGILESFADQVQAGRRLSEKQVATALKFDRKPRIERVALEDGIYLVDGTVYKVQHAVHGSGNQYAKRLEVASGERGRFKYEAGAVKRIRPEHRMDLAKAKEFGAIYGVCCNCGATLTNEDSIEAGIGPVCAAKF